MIGVIKILVINLFGVPCAGKCFGKNTEVLMYDNTIKYIQDIKIIDEVMSLYLTDIEE